MRARAVAPGRVNVIGDHTDYTGGLVLPMAIELATTVEVERGGHDVRLVSHDEQLPVVVPVDVDDPASVDPPWGRYVAGVVAELRPDTGASGNVTTTLPVGAGLSSSAALCVATALALGFDGSDLDLALLCQRAEQRASGVPCGVMDQLASIAGRDGHLLLIDCHTLAVQPQAFPDDAVVIGVHSGAPRALAGSAYAERRAQCEAAEAVIGPLRTAALGDVGAIDDPVVQRRARHIVTENARVLAFTGALAAGDLHACGQLMIESHRSLAEHFEVSTPVLDELVDRLVTTPGVHGARLTGAGFGGVVIALADAGARIDIDGWRFRPAAGARVYY